MESALRFFNKLCLGFASGGDLVIQGLQIVPIAESRVLAVVGQLEGLCRIVAEEGRNLGGAVVIDMVAPVAGVVVPIQADILQV